VIKTMAAAGKE